MYCRILLVCLLLIVPAIGSAASESVTAGQTNIYHVRVSSQWEADALSQVSRSAICRTGDGYLLAWPADIESILNESGLDYRLVACGVNPQCLYRDSRYDQSIALPFPVIFEGKGIRIYTIKGPLEEKYRSVHQLVHLTYGNLPIVYNEPLLQTFTVNRTDELEDLVNAINQDTLSAYLEHLQAYDSREAGTSGNRAASNWIKNKLIDFGYDSVSYDTGTWEGHGEIWPVRNVVCFKRGSVYPYHQIIMGAHFDASEDSPGADDNGSGTSGVLDFARVLAEYDNRMSLVFILFDTEEKEKGGSYLYANRAYQRGDNIEIMINLDMIGYNGNENDVLVNHGRMSDSCLARIWIDLADSIPGINLVGHPDNYTLSDDQSFSNLGYRILWLFEYIRSDVYHSPRDSTTYIDYDYMTRIIKTTLAFAYTIDQNFTPAYQLFMTGPEYPVSLLPDVSTPINITVLEFGGAALVPGSVLLHYIIDDIDTVATEMTLMGDGLYSADLPALPCGHVVEYYVTAEDDSLGVLQYPFTESGVRAYVTVDITYAFADDFGSDLGWTVTGDAPEINSWDINDVFYHNHWGTPEDDYDGNGCCYVTGAGNGLGVRGTSILTSPIIDASSGDMLVQYARWYANFAGGAPYTDSMLIYLSNNNGNTWALVESVGPVEQADGGWFLHEFWISSIMAPTAQMRLRFVASDLNELSYVEAGVDAVKFIDLSYGPKITTLSLPNWTSGVPYSRQLEAIVCGGEITWVDKYGHLNGSGLALSPSGLLEGTPAQPDNIFFIAKATGETGETDDRAYSFAINPALVITTSDVPNAIIDEYMNFQLKAVGGTGMRVWSDRDNILAPSGLTLSSSGMLSGTATTLSDISFTAQVVDEIGAVSERYYSFQVIGPFACGDTNADGGVNVGDAVFVINYVFKGGAAPDPECSGDSNGDGTCNVGDAVYLISHIFSGGPGPVDDCCL